jgi:hypothetical protein
VTGRSPPIGPEKPPPPEPDDAVEDIVADALDEDALDEDALDEDAPPAPLPVTASTLPQPTSVTRTEEPARRASGACRIAHV